MGAGFHSNIQATKVQLSSNTCTVRAVRSNRICGLVERRSGFQVRPGNYLSIQSMHERIRLRLEAVCQRTFKVRAVRLITVAVCV
jgi:hypothetical protein